MACFFSILTSHKNFNLFSYLTVQYFVNPLLLNQKSLSLSH